MTLLYKGVFQRMKKSLINILAVSSILLAAGCSAVQSTSSQKEAASSGADIAKVGDEVISFDEFYAELKAQAGVSTLRSMIVEKILTQSVSDAEVLRTAANEEVDAQIESAGGEEVFAQMLAYQNLGTVEAFRESVYVRNLFQEVIEKNLDMSDEAIQNYYETEYSPLMEAQHILVETEEEAQAVLDRLAAGEEFDALAQELSLDSTASNGGLLSPFTTGQMVPEFEEAVRSVENGELVPEPVQSQYGYHIIRTIQNGEKKPLDEVREEVKQAYLEANFNNSSVAYSIIGKLIKEKNVEIMDSDLQAALDDLMAAIENAEAQLSAAQETTVAEETTVVDETTAAEETQAEETTAAEETTQAE